VNGENTHPVYVFLRNNSELNNPKNGESQVIPWNFAKFIINNKGEVVHFFKPSKDIGDVRKAVEQML
jgi:glutathione peroxidase